MNWIIYSAISTLSFTGVVLLFKKLTEFDMKVEIINLYVFILTALTFLCFALFKKSPLQIAANSWHWFILLAIFAFFGNYYSLAALQTAPNPGYVRAIKSLEIVLVTAGSIMLFSSSISYRAMLGIFLTMGGLYLITSS